MKSFVEKHIKVSWLLYFSGDLWAISLLWTYVYLKLFDLFRSVLVRIIIAGSNMNIGSTEKRNLYSCGNYSINAFYSAIPTGVNEDVHLFFSWFFISFSGMELPHRGQVIR